MLDDCSYVLVIGPTASGGAAGSAYEAKSLEAVARKLADARARGGVRFARAYGVIDAGQGRKQRPLTIGEARDLARLTKEVV